MVQPITDIQPSLEVAFSNETLLLISLLGFTILFAGLACLCHLSPSQAKFDENNGGGGNGGGENGADDDEYNQLLQGADVSTLNRAQRKARARLLMKKHKRAAAADAAAAAAGGDGNDDNGDNRNANRNLVAVDAAGDIDEDDAMAPNNHTEGTRLSRKERQKAAKEEERLYRREYEEIRKLKIKDEIERRVAKEKLLEEKKELMERERQELQEEKLRSWKYMFGEESTTVHEFIRELKETQFLDLQEGANRFNVTIPSLISRLRDLEGEGRINHGVIDERRRIYFFVSPEDMTVVAKFIKQRESVTLDEVNAEVCRIILEKKRQVPT